MKTNLNKYELFDYGKNINRITEFDSVNNTVNVVKKISNNEYSKSDLKKLIKEVGKARLKAWDRKDNLDNAVDQVFRTWDLNSSPISGEDYSMDRLNEWQKDLVMRLKNMPNKEKVVFNNMGTYWEIMVVVTVASTRLTYEYSKLFNSFRENRDLHLELYVISSESYSSENSSGMVVKL